MNNSQIIMTHFGDDENDHEQYLTLIKNRFEYQDISFRQFPGKNIREQLSKFAADINADLIVMIHHHRTQFENIINSSKSKRMMNHHEVPLLILPG